MHYIYFHTIDGIIFYIGRGTQKEANTAKGKYQRAFKFEGRSQTWNKKAGSNKVEILIHKDNLSLDECYELEISLIAEYKDQLVNILPGGKDTESFKTMFPTFFRSGNHKKKEKPIPKRVSKHLENERNYIQENFYQMLPVDFKTVLQLSETARAIYEKQFELDITDFQNEVKEKTKKLIKDIRYADIKILFPVTVLTKIAHSMTVDNKYHSKREYGNVKYIKPNKN